MVPTQGVLDMLQAERFKNLRCWTHGVDTQLFAFDARAQTLAPHSLSFATIVRPMVLFAGRVSYEKNIDAMLKLALPGSQVICGVGPLEAQLKGLYLQAHWLGVLPERVYAAADVFVFPSRSETCGLPMLEAMAAGTPLVAFPVDGPLKVVELPDGSQLGGVLGSDLQTACHNALAEPRHEAPARALSFSGKYSAKLFERFLVPIRAAETEDARPLQNSVETTVTPLS